MSAQVVSRRAFLGGVALAGVAAASPWRPAKQRVGVVGAGVSGLACARTLADLGLEVVVFEARSRVGGRLHAAQAFGKTLELGADRFLPDERGAVFSAALAQHGLTTRPARLGWRVVDDAGTEYTEEQVDRSRERTRLALNAAVARAEGMHRRTSLREALAAASPEALNRVLDRTHLWLDVEHPAGVALEDMAPTSHRSPANGQSLFDQDSSVFVGHLAKGLDVRFQEAVHAVSWDDAGVELDLDGASERFDAVVLSLPLGVLLDGKVALQGGMPDAHQKALAALTPGVNEKLVLSFDKAFWPEGERRFVFTTGSPEGCTWFETVAGSPLLVGHVSTGVLASALEETRALELARRQLEGLFKTSYREPTGHLLTNWSADPFSLGSRSALAVSHRRRELAPLAEPIAPRVFLCGEHTYAESLGTLPGAFLSGLRAAAQVSRLVG